MILSGTVNLNIDSSFFEEMKRTILGSLKEFSLSSSVPVNTGSTNPPVVTNPTGSQPTSSIPPVVTSSIFIDKNDKKSTVPLGTNYPVVSSSIPPVGVWTQTQFGTKIKRLTKDSGVHIYSQLKPVTDDLKYTLIRQTSSGNLVVIDNTDQSVVFSVPTTWNAIRILDGHKLMAVLGMPVRVIIYDLDTKLTTTINTPWDTAQTSQTWEEPSSNGRIAMIAKKSSETDFTMSVIDLKTQSIVWSKTMTQIYTEAGLTGNGLPDWAAVSPSGKYLAIQWLKDGPARCNGLEVLDVNNGNFVRQVHSHHNHSDMYLRNGVDYVFTVQMSGAPLPTNNYPGIVLENMDTKEVTFLRLMNWGTTSHCSAMADDKNWALWDASEAKVDGTIPFAGEVYCINMTTGDCIHLCRHNSKSVDYWTQPKAALDKTGKYAIFSSDWGGTSNWHCYMVEIPQVF